MRSGISSAADVSLLLIEADSGAAHQTIAAIRGHWGEHTRVAHSAHTAHALRALRAERFDVILADIGAIKAGSASLEDGVSRLAQLADGALLIALSDGASVSSAVGAMQAGAHDFLAKPIGGQALAARLEELGQRHGKARALACDVAKGTEADFEGFVGTSPQMRAVYDQIVRIASSSAPVFITGESGTGKDVSAEALHKRSARADGPFIALNAGAIPRDLLESEMFGAVKGAYTGATQDRKGAVELAHGGTLFLDEIGEMDLSLQSKLLRFLQTGTITRVGDAKALDVDVRIVCATNRNPMQLVTDKKFREDLFYRLHVLPIHLPPLRQRPADIMTLANCFLKRFAAEENKQFSGFDSEVADLFVAREWPGNVRQLQNLVRRIVVMFDGGLVTPEMANAADIEARGHMGAAAPASTATPEVLPMWQQEQKIIEDALAAFGGNIARAAAALEISPSTIYRKKLNWEREGKLAGAA
ncbi:sigma-54-dependent transcriptional regulator [Pelagibacterium xiamenense]|uniref:sigma-54-dependent transcriptional regulator n=1 Tax=Pelagibacterium xiamenense TaxID=2901140 RepID=UPI001E3F7323|nr:sigma-54 dependent transcriptional regulator [Pelagibacterium xiamenense]MCD7059207.1 sigma-54 dependent transcriptional regulator [Pelagibacterium xiamenense]